MREIKYSFKEVQKGIDQQLADIEAENRQQMDADEEQNQNHNKLLLLIKKLKDMMKRKLFLALTLMLVTSVGVRAQHWTLSHQGEGASTETIIYAQLDLGSPAASPIYSNYEVAAFIGDEVRAIASYESSPAGDDNYFVLNVKGNYDQAGTEDDGKTITFKLYNTATSIEYDLTSADITFDGAKHGTIDALFTLSAVEIESISIDDIEMNKGDVIDLYTLMTLDPVNATLPNQITWSVTGYESYLSVTEDGELTALAVGDNLWLTYEYGMGIIKSVMVTVKNPATAINVNSGYETIIVNVGDETTLTQKLSEAIVLTPADATDTYTWTSSDETVVIQNMTNANWSPLKKGQVTMTATIVGNPSLTANLTVKVVEPLTSFLINIPDPMLAGTTNEITVTPQPADADFDISYLTYEISDSNLPDGWSVIEVVNSKLDNDENVIYTVNAVNPGSVNFRVKYNDGSNVVNSDPQTVNVAVALALTSGWQWMTPWTDIESENMAKAFTNDLNEIRSQESLMANDATYGYYGALATSGLTANTAYKVNMDAAVAAADAYVMSGGTYLASSLNQDLKKGWTWIPYPYYHSYDINGLGIAGADGDRIVSFNDGFAEYDGSSWTGTLTELTPRQAYMYYNNSGDASSFKWTDEPVVFTNNAAAPSRRMAPRNTLESVWKYDASRFSENMSIIAQLDNVSFTDDYTVGAFVGDDCRGEGRCIDGKMFITVHADKGELINFRLYNTATGEYSSVEETVRMNMMLGSLRAPYRLTAEGNVVTKLEDLTVSSADKAAYDLQGRRLQTAPEKGIYIVGGKKIIK